MAQSARLRAKNMMKKKKKREGKRVVRSQFTVRKI
jgi:hypothetical protein